MPSLLGAKGVTRNLILALATFATVYLLLQSFHLGPFAPNAARFIAPYASRGGPRITKVTERIEPMNDLYLRSLQSHEEHDRMNGYEMRLFQERIVDVYHSRPTYLLSIIVAELQKPVEQRIHWLAWFSGDVVLLNPQIPLEIFLPPRDFDYVNFLGTQDEHGFNAGVFFIRVNVWGAQMLADVLSRSKTDEEISKAAFKHQKAFEMTLRSVTFRESVMYQPRTWYNTYPRELSPNGEKGELLVHFNRPDGDKWAGMDEKLGQLFKAPSTFSVSLQNTLYPAEITAFWNRVREAYELLPQAQAQINNQAVQDAVRRLQYAMTYEVDRAEVVTQAIDKMKVALGIK